MSSFRKSKNGSAKALPVILAICIAWGAGASAMYLMERGAYVSLMENYGILESNYGNALDAYDSLETNYDSLNSQYETLQSYYGGLQQNYTSLHDDYQDYLDMVSLRWGLGTNCTKFITPADSNVTSKTRQVLGHPGDGDLSWSDMSKINDWVGTNIKYNNDTYVGRPGELKNGSECWLFPNETLALGYGDCEDHALLMMSMCNAEQGIGWIWAAEVTIGNTDGTTSGHMLVFVNVDGDKVYIYDPTVAGGWDSGTARSEQDALDHYKNSLSGISSIKVDTVFNQTERRDFESNQEFFDWF
ncbi:MAG: transglutaminase-like domain-containing protein [Candidatus Thermoplasmatota archaeon]|nr:transglutaminase-like domain-containing protein [Candidatus Thermoplasmatota archaeon]